MIPAQFAGAQNPGVNGSVPTRLVDDMPIFPEITGLSYWQAGPGPEPAALPRTLRLSGNIPPEVWNRLGTRILPKLRSGSGLSIGLEFSVTVSAEAASGLVAELRQILQELGLAEAVKVE